MGFLSVGASNPQLFSNSLPRGANNFRAAIMAKRWHISPKFVLKGIVQVACGLDAMLGINTEIIFYVSRIAAINKSAAFTF